MWKDQSPSEIREKWFQALESGQYKQQFHRLYKNYDGYCALGVLHEIVGLKSPIEFSTVENLRDFLGLDIPHIIVMNDVDKLRFPEIAAKLRQEFNQEKKDEESA